MAEERDPKGLYKKARAGELVHFTGIDSPYERPEQPDVHIETAAVSQSEAARLLIEALERRGRLGPPSDVTSDPSSTGSRAAHSLA